MFLGHAFEVINHARDFGLYVPTSAQEEVVGRAQQELFDVVETIGSETPKKSEGPRAFVGDEILFRFLVGDACHAYRALSLTSKA